MFKRIAAASGIVATTIGRALPTVIRDVAGLAGVGLIAYGAWLIMPAAGYITGGALLVLGVVLISANRGTGA